jgi:hypothetical protein
MIEFWRTELGWMCSFSLHLVPTWGEGGWWWWWCPFTPLWSVGRLRNFRI